MPKSGKNSDFKQLYESIFQSDYGENLDDDRIVLFGKKVQESTSDEIWRWLKISATIVMLFLFITGNFLVYYMVHRAFEIDQIQLEKELILPSERLINSGVILSLIAATLAEVASAVLIFFNSAFPKSKQ